MSHPVRRAPRAGVLLLCAILPAVPVLADEAGETALAMQLSNPVAALISVPLQLNYDQDIGPADDGDRWLLNVQPVIPFGLNDEWNLISRTILPVVRQSDIFPGAGTQTGTGDVVQSIFFSPKAPTASGWIWGAGPVLLLPTGSNDLLTTDKWGAGPTAVVLKQSNGWTRGVLANHIWSFAGDDDRADVDATFLQPFLTYTTPTQWTFAVNTESSYDWENEQWSVPVNASASKLMRFGTQLVSLGGGVRYWLDSPDSGAEGFGVQDHGDAAVPPVITSTTWQGLHEFHASSAVVARDPDRRRGAGGNGDRAHPGDARLARLRHGGRRLRRPQEQYRRRQQPDRHRAADHQLGGTAAAERRHLSPRRHGRDQLHVRQRLAGLLRYLARGRGHARRRDPARRPQGPGLRRHPAGRLPVQRHPHAGLGGPVRRGRAARGDRSRLRPACACSGTASSARRSSSRSRTGTSRSTPSAAARASRASPAMRPARTCCGATATSTTSMRPTCSGWARVGVTSCGPWSATRSTTATARRSAATLTGCS